MLRGNHFQSAGKKPSEDDFSGKAFTDRVLENDIRCAKPSRFSLLLLLLLPSTAAFFNGMVSRGRRLASKKPVRGDHSRHPNLTQLVRLLVNIDLSLTDPDPGVGLRPNMLALSYLHLLVELSGFLHRPAISAKPIPGTQPR